jgi:hypothetical protein
MAPWRLALVIPLFAVSCFSPDPLKRTIRCDTENPCPDGLSCQSSLCVDPSGSDGSTNTPDLGPPDLTPVGTSRCADGGGTSLGAAWACPGTFGGPNPSASKRCAMGSVPCGNGNGINQMLCKSLPGFFVGSYVGRHTSGATVTCMMASGGNRGIFGCGTGGAMQQTACMGFEQALICATTTEWQCADMIDQVRNDNANNGVLCCQQ